MYKSLIKLTNPFCFDCVKIKFNALIIVAGLMFVAFAFNVPRDNDEMISR